MYLALGKNETVPKTLGHELFSTHTLPCPNQSSLFRHHDSHNNLCCHLQLLEAKLRITCVCTSRAETPLSSLPFSPSNTPHDKTSIHNQGSGHTHVTGQKPEAPAEKHFSPAENSVPRGAVLQTWLHCRLAMKHQSSFITYLGNRIQISSLPRPEESRLSFGHAATCWRTRLHVSSLLKTISTYNVHVGPFVVAHDHRAEVTSKRQKLCNSLH